MCIEISCGKPNYNHTQYNNILYAFLHVQHSNETEKTALYEYIQSEVDQSLYYQVYIIITVFTLDNSIATYNLQHLSVYVTQDPGIMRLAGRVLPRAGAEG